VGTIHRAQPGSQKWVDGFDHAGVHLWLFRVSGYGVQFWLGLGWLDMIEYYIKAFTGKTGAHPDIKYSCGRGYIPAVRMPRTR
jgi:hypothetical protein